MIVRCNLTRSLFIYALLQPLNILDGQLTHKDRVQWSFGNGKSEL